MKNQTRFRGRVLPGYSCLLVHNLCVKKDKLFLIPFFFGGVYIKSVMKGNGQLLAGLFLVVNCLFAKADRPIFGNSPGQGRAFNLEFESGNTFGGAILFTPTNDICLSSVTMWLEDYNGQNGIIPSVAIYSSQEQSPGNYQLASEIAALDTPAPNDGSMGAFTFTDSSGTTTLDANMAYWLFAYGMWDGTTNFNGATCYWDSGTTPSGDAIYMQADSFNNGTLTGPSSAMPAFVINVVPEPGFATLLSIPLTFGFRRALCRQRILRM